MLAAGIRHRHRGAAITISEWSEKLKSAGLYPSSTGMVGGKETGQHMSDYVIPDGPFVRSYENWLRRDGDSICNRRRMPTRSGDRS